MYATLRSVRGAGLLGLAWAALVAAPASGQERKPRLIFGGVQHAKTEPDAVSLKDAKSKQERLPFGAGHTDEVYSLAYSPDGRMLASGSIDSTVRLWDAETGKATATLARTGGNAFWLAFSPDGKLLASTCDSVMLWDVKASKHYVNLGERCLAAGADAVAISPDGQFLASGGRDAKVRIWYRPAAMASAVLAGAKERMDHWLKDHQGKFGLTTARGRLISASADNVLQLWEEVVGNGMRTLDGHRGSVYSVAFIPDGRTLASAGFDGFIRLWEVRSGREIASFHTGHGSLARMACSPDGKMLATTGDRNIKLWDLATRKEIANYAHGENVHAIAFSPDSKVLAVTLDQTVKIWDVQAGTEVVTFKGHPGHVRAIAFSSNGRTLAAASNNLIFLWDVPAPPKETGQ